METESPSVEEGAPDAELIQGTDPAKLQEMHERLAAASSKTPAVARHALAPSALQGPGLRLHVYTVQTQINLEQLYSPFVRRGQAQKEISFAEVRNALWAMSVPDEQVEDLLYAGGDTLRHVLSAFGASIPMGQLAPLAALINENIARAFEPSAHLNPPHKEGETSTNFTAPATAPAGS
jgi:hypothetical protein